jgi:hypothetical protein
MMSERMTGFAYKIEPNLSVIFVCEAHFGKLSGGAFWENYSYGILSTIEDLCFTIIRRLL